MSSNSNANLIGKYVICIDGEYQDWTNQKGFTGIYEIGKVVGVGVGRAMLVRFATSSITVSLERLNDPSKYHFVESTHAVKAVVEMKLAFECLPDEALAMRFTIDARFIKLAFSALCTLADTDFEVIGGPVGSVDWNCTDASYDLAFPSVYFGEGPTYELMVWFESTSGACYETVAMPLWKMLEAFIKGGEGSYFGDSIAAKADTLVWPKRVENCAS